MCRLFALRSRHPASVERLLLDAPRSISRLSVEHCHGWGLAQYRGGELALARGTDPAWQDPNFERVARSVWSPCVVAHVRRRSVGSLGMDNVHPFRYGRLVFAHNGTVKGFEALRSGIEAAISPRFAGLLRGSTDTERCFYLFLTRLASRGALERPKMQDIAEALAATVHQLRARPSPDGLAHLLTFVASDGDSVVAVREGEKELWLCTGSDRVPGPGEREEQLVIASEPLTDDPWHPVGDGEVIGIDGRMTLERWRLSDFAPPVAA